jgi:hypothetical protein
MPVPLSGSTPGQADTVVRFDSFDPKQPAQRHGRQSIVGVMDEQDKQDIFNAYDNLNNLAKSCTQDLAPFDQWRLDMALMLLDRLGGKVGLWQRAWSDEQVEKASRWEN